VLAIDPGFRTGCKIAALDETGSLLEDGVIFLPGIRAPGGRSRGPKGARGPRPEPAAAMLSLGQTPSVIAAAGALPIQPAPEQHMMPPDVGFPVSIELPPISAFAVAPLESPAASPAAGPPSAPLLVAEAPPTALPPLPPPAPAATAKLEEIIRNHRVDVIAIGNGSACRETEELVSDLIGEKLSDLAYVIVNEAGASVYSASAMGGRNFRITMPRCAAPSRLAAGCKTRSASL